MSSDSTALRIATLGAGSWGTALAAHLSSNQHQVCLWGRDESQILAMQQNGINQRYLPDVRLPDSLEFTTDLSTCVSGASVVVIATPCHSFRSMLQAIAPSLAKGTTLVWACKGITENKLLHTIVEDTFADKYPAGIISGPSFARELVLGLPTAATVAAKDLETANTIGGWFHSDSFRAYASADLIGVQIAGALKNVYAIAAGISDGLGYGANARAALITRGLAELMRLGTAMGASQATLMGLSGVGDLVLTCTDDQSRNRRFGLALGEGLASEQAVKRIGQVVEGINTCREAATLSKQHAVDMPITEEVYNVVHQNKSPAKAVADLLARAQKSELD